MDFGSTTRFTSTSRNTDSQQASSETPSRRTARIRTKPQKYGDFLELSPSKRRSKQLIFSDDESDIENMDVSPQKPTALFSNDDVTGKDMFKFKSRHTKNDLHNKVSEAITNSPKSPLKLNFKCVQSPRLNVNKENQATPKRVKDVIKKRIIQEVDSDSEESDFSGSSSDDFVPKESDKESEQSSSSFEEEEVLPKKTPSKLRAAKEKQIKTKAKDTDYYVTPDNYFMMNSSKKIATSDRTLSRLKNLDINEHVTGIQLSAEHSCKIAELNKSYHRLFNKWLYILSEDFNIILYGIGSKRLILQRFQKEKLKDFPCVVVNGYFPSLTMKSILEAVVIDLLENSHVPSNVGDVVSLIESQLEENGVDLFLIVNNIDGPMLRSAKCQAVLASIAQLKRVHVIATIDHINAPLLWDHSKMSKFMFTWWDVTTFLPYAEETSYENSLMSQRSGALQLSSLRAVYQSLTTNAKSIYSILIEYQLENCKQAHYQGLPFKDLYTKSREQFLVSSDLALRAQLTEFLDHKLVKIKRTYDGSENLIIPIENSLLQEFLEKQNT